MKNNESISRAIENQKKTVDIKTARLKAIDKKLASPREQSVESIHEIKKKEPVLKNKLKPAKVESEVESE